MRIQNQTYETDRQITTNEIEMHHGLAPTATVVVVDTHHFFRGNPFFLKEGNGYDDNKREGSIVCIYYYPSDAQCNAMHEEYALAESSSTRY